MFTLERRLRDILSAIEKEAFFDGNGFLTWAGNGRETQRYATPPDRFIDIHQQTDLSSRLWGHTILFQVTANSLVELVVDRATVNGTVSLDSKCSLCTGEGAIYQAAESILALLYESGKMRYAELAAENVLHDTGSNCTTKRAIDKLLEKGLVVRGPKRLFSLTDLGSEIAKTAISTAHSFRDCNERWWFDGEHDPDRDCYSLQDVSDYFLCDIHSLRSVATDALQLRERLILSRPCIAA